MKHVTTDPISDLRTLTRRHPGLAQVGAALAMYEGGRSALATFRDWYGKHCTYSVTVRESDRIYDAVLDWLMELLPTGSQRKLIASTSSGARYDAADPDQPRRQPLRVHYADHQTLTVVIDGHRVRVTLQADDSTDKERTRPDRYVELSCRTKMGLIRGVRPRSLLLLEDIDTARVTHDRAAGDQPEGTVSMASLLNALDGVATPHGLITIMTTNHFDKLDDALTRPGRMDRIEHLDLPSTSELEILYRRFYGRPLHLDHLGRVPLSQAEVSEIFKRHLHDPSAAARDLAAAVQLEAVR